MVAIAQEAKTIPSGENRAAYNAVKRLDEARAARKPVLRWSRDPAASPKIKAAVTSVGELSRISTP